ncbi:MAG: Gfo/Idh/MocA family oxidoreductase [Phycisphaerae bacterium]|jgi:predicted dehydrogenase
MGHHVTRRSLLRTSAVGASAVALGAGSARAFAANGKVELGWIGYGGRAVGLMQKILTSCPDARVRAICDLKPDRVELGLKAAQRDKPKGYRDLHEMLDKEKLDAVLVVTQPSVHADTMVPVLERHIHCFGEKPMDISVEAIDRLTAAARKSKGIYQIGTQRRYHPTYLKTMKAIHDGLMGRVTFMQGGWHWSSDPSGAPVSYDGGRFIEQASHHMDVMSWAMKNQHPVTCVAMAYQDKEPKDPNQFSETKSATIFQFPDGVLFSYTHLWILPGKYDDEILLAFGEKGAMDFNEALYTGRDEKEQRFGKAIGKGWDEGSTEELIDFIDNVKTGGRRVPNANVETGRICSLMCVMARMAMVNKARNAYEPSVVRWSDLKSTTEPQAASV